MAERVWMSDAGGTRAHVPKSAVDTWVGRGWAEASPPADTDFVWMQHEGHGGRQMFGGGAALTWALLGWSPSEPPEPVDLLHDRQLVDERPEPEPKRSAKSKAETGKE